ncbi:hypothetical protein PV325_012861 [Microctonus aethiopoides]|nr:hypothetical protein PV325_012861 [Microctonus aethiopoides]KAK0094615.1 hypothetical protein PV326_010470 [Microctonus aethiopoides]
MDVQQKFHAMAKNITVVSPDTPEELLLIVKQLKKFIQSSLDLCPVRVIIIDSLSFSIVSLNDTSHKITYYNEILNELQRLASKYNIAVVIVNELVTQVNKNNEISFESAGGQAVSSRCNKRIMLARIRDSKFAARLLKSSTMPQVATVFNITSQGIRDEPSIKK